MEWNIKEMFFFFFKPITVLESSRFAMLSLLINVEC